MKNGARLSVLFSILFLAISPFGSLSAESRASLDTSSLIPTDPKLARPIQKGALLPDAVLRQADGTATSLKQITSGKPTVLIFYRGGWCPYCNTQLGKLAEIEPELRQLGYQIFGISPDRPAKVQESIAKHKPSYTLLSDSKMEVSKAFGLAFRVEDTLVQKYKSEYNIDIEADSGETHHLLPVPAAYVVDQSGVLQFSYYNPDYKTRVSARELLDAARESARPF